MNIQPLLDLALTYFETILIQSLIDLHLSTFAPIATALLYCARCSLGTRVPSHVFQARAPIRNSTKYRADVFCVNLVCKYFAGSLVTATFFSGDHFLFLILSIILKLKKKSVRNFN